jgi:hypothetical protein
LQADLGHGRDERVKLRQELAAARAECKRLRVSRFRVIRETDTPGFSLTGWCYSFHDHFELHWDDGTHEMWRAELSTDGTRKEAARAAGGGNVSDTPTYSIRCGMYYRNGEQIDALTELCELSGELAAARTLMREGCRLLDDDVQLKDPEWINFEQAARAAGGDS